MDFGSYILGGVSVLVSLLLGFFLGVGKNVAQAQSSKDDIDPKDVPGVKPHG